MIQTDDSNWRSQWALSSTQSYWDECSHAVPDVWCFDLYFRCEEGGGGLTRGGLVFGWPRSACVRLSVCMLDSKRRFLLFDPDTCAASFHKLVNNNLLLVIVIWRLSADHFWTPDINFCIDVVRNNTSKL